MIKRDIYEEFKLLKNEYPVVLVTGPRQSGKSTFIKAESSEYSYVSLEDLDNRLFALDDPRSFLEKLGDKAIIDEAQYVPELFSYIQTIVDKENKSGMFILSGSQNFKLMENVTQSLAGRVGILTLLPLSRLELKNSKIIYESVEDLIFTGGYPRIYDKNIRPQRYYSYYIDTYIERDVRTLKAVHNLELFKTFIKLCADRIGSVLNYESLARATGINVKTVKEWLTVLETSYIVFKLPPYYKNFEKRITKSPKLYFYDTGLAANLLGIKKIDMIKQNPNYGHLFENYIITELLKKNYNRGEIPNLYFWSENENNEIDLIFEENSKINAYEIKSSKTMKPQFAKNLNNFSKFAKDIEQLCVVYAGELEPKIQDVKFISWKSW
ncbi:MAG: ATP-binding protein [Candidatus Ancillula sp.]|jgi:predicted AAA+ superfamily ATPase|nr:ATP-binding protein [Candidatus Ancillula sp.]